MIPGQKSETKMCLHNSGIWWSFLISETVTVVLAIIYLGAAKKKDLIKCNSGNIKYLK